MQVHHLIFYLFYHKIFMIITLRGGWYQNFINSIRKSDTIVSKKLSAILQKNLFCYFYMMRHFNES